MRALIVLILGLAPAAIHAQEAPATPPAAPPAAEARAEIAAAIEAVIAAQLQAFNDRDVPAAWTHASPFIQGVFGTSGNFGAMVEQGYPMVWTNRDARFLDLRPEAGTLRQRVLIGDEAGRLWMLDYDMVETEDGWKINGVVINPAPEQVA